MSFTSSTSSNVSWLSFLAYIVARNEFKLLLLWMLRLYLVSVFLQTALKLKTRWLRRAAHAETNPLWVLIYPVYGLSLTLISTFSVGMAVIFATSKDPGEQESLKERKLQNRRVVSHVTPLFVSADGVPSVWPKTWEFSPWMKNQAHKCQ
eukprot:TRINITY_DN17405_c0_g1_i1.p1 TRINITY_DN17405_c0_g1~~TRINITY_DN17405_c0_g1_i1.p1  ORF type:complete len:150 (+),score=22.74 TRINITY_DN17405_c0_g1_i1:391-840(+)